MGRIRDAKTNIVTVIGLIIVPVLGLLLMWRYTSWSVRTKQIWTLVAISLWVVGLALKLA